MDEVNSQIKKIVFRLRMSLTYPCVTEQDIHKTYYGFLFRRCEN